MNDIDLYEMGLEGDLTTLHDLNKEALKTADQGPYAGPYIVQGLLARVERLTDELESVRPVAEAAVAWITASEEARKLHIKYGVRHLQPYAEALARAARKFREGAV